jgi:hypothetical protein
MAKEPGKDVLHSGVELDFPIQVRVNEGLAFAMHHQAEPSVLKPGNLESSGGMIKGVQELRSP